MSLAVQILAALDTLAREERERAELGARLMGYALEDLEALVKMLLSMFESGEFLRFLRFSSDTAGILPLIPTGVAAPIQVFSQAVTALAQHALIDPRFFERLVAERPRREPEIRKMQARLLRA